MQKTSIRRSRQIARGRLAMTGRVAMLEISRWSKAGAAIERAAVFRPGDPVGEPILRGFLPAVPLA